MRRPRIATVALLVAAAGAYCIRPASPATTTAFVPSHAVPAAKREAREAAFLRTVDPRNSANVVTGDLEHFAGTHVAYDCDVDTIVRPGVILGQCGSAAEPLDLFIHLTTPGLRAGDRIRVLGIMEPPATWTDVTGHTVYYAFLKAVYVDRIR